MVLVWVSWNWMFLFKLIGIAGHVSFLGDLRVYVEGI